MVKSKNGQDIQMSNISLINKIEKKIVFDTVYFISINFCKMCTVQVNKIS